jgi:hypothetical protein
MLNDNVPESEWKNGMSVEDGEYPIVMGVRTHCCLANQPQVLCKVLCDTMWG